MAPELIKELGPSPQSDIWSVGCVVVEMLTGRRPWFEYSELQAIFKVRWHGGMAEWEMTWEMTWEMRKGKRTIMVT